MKRTPITNISSSGNVITHDHNILLIGSCFTENIGSHLNDFGFQVATNPTGIIFNPLSWLKLFQSLNDLELLESSVFKSDDVWLSWLMHSSIYAYSENEMKTLVDTKIKALKANILNAQHIFMTFGTIYYYEHLSFGTVANCHKVRKQKFTKNELTYTETVKAIEQIITIIKTLNPAINITFTVSPIRHIKDGIIENSVSKSRLISAIHEVISKNTEIGYFPSYEIMIDELRDYSYYKADGIHPNHFAIDYIWEKFSDCYFEQNTKHIISEIKKLKTAMNHKLLFPESKKAKAFKAQLEEKIEQFKIKFPRIKL